MMNKQRILMILVVIGTGSIFADESPRAIRKDLKEKYVQGQLDECHLAEDGLTFAEVLDRDITIMENHKKYLTREISSCKRGFRRDIVIAAKALESLVFAGVSIGSGLLALGGSIWVNDLWSGSGNISIKLASIYNYIAPYMWLLSKADVDKRQQQKFYQISSKNEDFKEIASLVPPMGMISVLSGILFMKAAVSLCKHDRVLDMTIARLKKRVKHDNAIIAKLKELRYGVRKTIPVVERLLDGEV
jgi:hypothetical protein